jgi:uncharacterized membrane protein
MSESSAQRLLAWVLGRFYRLALGLLGLGFGLLWATLGLGKALLVTALAVLGWLAGKWLDEGRPDAGLSRRVRRLFDEN